MAVAAVESRRRAAVGQHPTLILAILFSCCAMSTGDVTCYGYDEIGDMLPDTTSNDEWEWSHYHNYTSMEIVLKRMVQDYPDKTCVYSIGTSVDGRELWAIELSNKNLGQPDDGRPNVKYIGNMHGNEAVSRELLLRLAQYILDSSVNTSNPDSVLINKLLETTHVHILASMNPDGFENSTEGQCEGAKGRYNANGIDLNRNFPDRFNRSQGAIQPETQAVMSWLQEIPFVLSANFHGGQLVANYPYDSTESGQVGYARASDDSVFRRLAHTYANAHPTMHLGLRNCEPEDNTSFPDGITNGAQWYVVDGGVQDYNYLHSNSFELTIEMGCCKYPPASDLQRQWANHLPALLAYLNVTFQNARGRLLSAGNLSLVEARIIVHRSNGTHATTPTKAGYFWRLLDVGNHTMTFSAQGHDAVTRSVFIEPGMSTDLGLLALEVIPSPTNASSSPSSAPAGSTSSNSPSSAPTGSTSQPTGVPPRRRLLSVGAWIGILFSAAVLTTLIVVVFINLRRFVRQRRRYMAIGEGTGTHVSMGGVKQQSLGRLY